MDRFQLDFGMLNEVINPDTSRVPYKDNEDKFVRVAFDLFKTKDNSCEDLWKIQADDDGKEYLVRTYDVDDTVVEANWSVALNKTASNLTVFYKGTPIHRLTTADYGVNNEKEALLLRDVIQEKLASSKEFLVKFANELSTEKRKVLADMGAIDPADLAKSPEDYPETYHGPGFKKNPVTSPPKITPETVVWILSVIQKDLEAAINMDGEEVYKQLKKTNKSIDSIIRGLSNE